MSDKILTEAFDKMKAIEESDDPFCIGATGDSEFAEAYTPVEEEAIEEAASVDWDQPNEYEMTDDSGQHYAVHFQQGHKEDIAIIEVNGITVAHYEVGGAGPMNANIKNPEAVLEALTAALMKAGR